MRRHMRRRIHTFSTWTDAEADTPMKLVAWVGRRIHCYMRRRILVMRRRIHCYDEEDTLL